MNGPPHEGYRNRGLLIARESFTYYDPSTHKQVKVVAGRTHVSPDCVANKVRPDAFQYA